MEPKLKALLKQIDSGKIKSNAAKVLSYVIKSRICTQKDVEFATGMSHENVSARFSDLEDLGIVQKSGTIETRHGTLSTYIYEKDPIKQYDYAHERKMKKYGQWLKKGKREFSEFMDKTTFEMLTT